MIEDRYAAFRHKAYRRYWGAQFLGTFANQMIAVAIGWQLYDLTRDPLDLGLIGLFNFLPSLVLVLVTGAVADRFGRRRVMLLSEALFFAVALGFFILTFVGLTSPIPVFALVLVLGIGRAFYGPASSSLVVNLVPEKDFANAVAWKSSAWQVATIVGPVMGGLGYGLSPLLPHGAAMVMLFFAIILIANIPEPARRAATKGARSASELFAGFRYVFQQKVVLGAISLDLFAVLLGGAVALLPVFASDVLDVGPLGLGMLRAAPGIGAVLTALLLAAYPIRNHAGVIMFVCVMLFGFFTAVFGFSKLAWLSIFALGMLGAADMISVYIRETIIQLWTPDAVRGRVNAVNSLFIGASNELGELRAGVMAAFIGAVPAVWLGGVGAIGIAAIWMVMFPQLRKIRSLTLGPDQDKS